MRDNIGNMPALFDVVKGEGNIKAIRNGVAGVGIAEVPLHRPASPTRLHNTGHQTWRFGHRSLSKQTLFLGNCRVVCAVIVTSRVRDSSDDGVRGGCVRITRTLDHKQLYIITHRTLLRTHRIRSITHYMLHTTYYVLHTIPHTTQLASPGSFPSPTPFSHPTLSPSTPSTPPTPSTPTSNR